MKIDKKDAALIIHPDGSIEICIPKVDEDRDVPLYILTVCALGAMTGDDPEWVQAQIERFLMAAWPETTPQACPPQCAPGIKCDYCSSEANPATAPVSAALKEVTADSDEKAGKG